MYDHILIKYDKNYPIHVEKFQERHFLEIKKSNAKNHTGLGWGRAHWGITHSPTHSKCSYSTPYSRGLLKAPEECLLINYCNTIDTNSFLRNHHASMDTRYKCSPLDESCL